MYSIQPNAKISCQQIYDSSPCTHTARHADPHLSEHCVSYMSETLAKYLTTHLKRERFECRVRCGRARSSALQTHSAIEMRSPCVGFARQVFTRRYSGEVATHFCVHKRREVVVHCHCEAAVHVAGIPAHRTQHGLQPRASNPQQQIG